ncbi:MAG TPA: TIGR03960 family B12-binding radical SAM protein [Chloroflexota bacterium]|nr:TIGR03960 family B12-binding radical SAM protein [Chloroflexota bacterium]
MKVSQEQLDIVLPRVSKPARYTGGELNQVVKPEAEVDLRVVLAFPDVYEVGSSNMGLQILYHIVNLQPGMQAERAYCPWPDMEAAMREHAIPMYSLETRRPLSEADVLGFGLASEMNYTGVLTMLDMAGIPLHAEQRRDGDPIVIAGGHCTCNPEPMAAFVDLFLLGEGEELLLDVLNCYRAHRSKGRRAVLKATSQIPGVYWPAEFELDYQPDGIIREISPAKRILRRKVDDLESIPYPTAPVVPFTGIIHDRAPIEIQRGCTRGCRFCQAGMITRPTRERSKETILNIARQLAENTGFEEVSLLSLSAGDYSDAKGLVKAMMDEFKDSNVSVAMPALRVDSFVVDLAKEIAQVRKTGFTFAPEAGSQRLRDVINKGVSNEDLLKAVEGAFSEGWQSIKLYYMMGLPTETMDDLQEMADVVKRVAALGFRYHGPKASVHVSVSSFVPKPHTPFQWVGQDTMETYGDKVKFLQQHIRGRGLRLSWNHPEESLIEGALARGDRRLAGVIERAWEMGCRFDAWGDQFKFGLWRQAFEDRGLDPRFYANRQRGYLEILPWAHIDYGVTDAFLLDEWHHALRAGFTEDCKTDGCSLCNACERGEVGFSGLYPVKIPGKIPVAAR